MPEVQAALGIRHVLVERSVAAGCSTTRPLDLDDVSAQERQGTAAELGVLVGDLEDANAAQVPVGWGIDVDGGVLGHRPSSVRRKNGSETVSVTSRNVTSTGAPTTSQGTGPSSSVAMNKS